ncbi:hypothetical protein D3C87_1861800 [compost metagenome]
MIFELRYPQIIYLRFQPTYRRLGEQQTIIWNEREQRTTDEIRMISVSIFMEMMIVMKP